MQGLRSPITTTTAPLTLAFCGKTLERFSLLDSFEATLLAMCDLDHNNIGIDLKALSAH